MTITDIRPLPDGGEVFVLATGETVRADEDRAYIVETGQDIDFDLFDSAVWDYIVTHNGPKPSWAEELMNLGYRGLVNSLQDYLDGKERPW